MRTSLVVAALAAATVVPIAPASADLAFQHVGGCSFNAVSDPTPDGNLGGQDVYTGQVSGRIVVVDAAGGPTNAGTSTLTCTVTVNAVPQDSVTGSGVVVVAAADTLTYVRGATDVVELCTDVTYPDGSTFHSCVGSTTLRIPPQEVSDLLGQVFDVLIDVAEQVDAILLDVEQTVVDPVLCQALVAASGSDVPGVLDIEDDGDVYVAGEFFWNCPPYT